MDTLTTAEVMDADLGDWRLLAHTLHARFLTRGFAAGATFVASVAEAAEAANHHPDVTVTFPWVWTSGCAATTPQTSAHQPPRRRFHVDLWVPHDVADDRIAAAVAAGGTVVDDAQAPTFVVLADAEGNKACVCTCLGR